MRAMRNGFAVAMLGLWVTLFAGCEGTTTGTEIAKVPLQAADGGGYAPAKFTLATGMNPVSINFRADFSQNPDDFGKWNTYRVALSKDGSVVASRNININHPQTRRPQGDTNDAPPPTGTVHPLFVTDVQASGDYELTITALQPPAITLSNPTVDVRRNVARGPQ